MCARLKSEVSFKLASSMTCGVGQHEGSRGVGDQLAAASTIARGGVFQHQVMSCVMR